MTSNPKQDAVIWRGNFGCRHTGRMPCDHGCRDARNTRITSNYHEPKHEEASSLRALPGSMTLPSPWCWTSGLQNYKRINFYCLNPPNCGNVLQQPSEMNAGPARHSQSTLHFLIRVYTLPVFTGLLVCCKSVISHMRARTYYSPNR